MSLLLNHTHHFFSQILPQITYLQFHHERPSRPYFILEDGQVQTIWIAGINRSGKCVAKLNTHTTDIFWLFALPLHIHLVQLCYSAIDDPRSRMAYLGTQLGSFSVFSLHMHISKVRSLYGKEEPNMCT